MIYQRKEASETALKAFQQGRRTSSARIMGSRRSSRVSVFCVASSVTRRKIATATPITARSRSMRFLQRLRIRGHGFWTAGQAVICALREKNSMRFVPFETPVPISIANGCEVKALGTGSVPIVLSDGTLIRALRRVVGARVGSTFDFDICVGCQGFEASSLSVMCARSATERSKSLAFDAMGSCLCSIASHDRMLAVPRRAEATSEPSYGTQDSVTTQCPT